MELGLLLNKLISDLSPHDAANIEFARVKELIDVQHGNLEVEGFPDDELEQIVEFLCTS